MTSTSNDTDAIETSLSVCWMLLKPVACVHPLESAHPQLIPPGHQIPDWMFGQYSSWGIQTVVLGGMGIFVGDPLRTQTIGEVCLTQRSTEAPRFDEDDGSVT